MKRHTTAPPSVRSRRSRVTAADGEEPRRVGRPERDHPGFLKSGLRGKRHLRGERRFLPERQRPGLDRSIRTDDRGQRVARALVGAMSTFPTSPIGSARPVSTTRRSVAACSSSSPPQGWRTPRPWGVTSIPKPSCVWWGRRASRKRRGWDTGFSRHGLRSSRRGVLARPVTRVATRFIGTGIGESVADGDRRRFPAVGHAQLADHVRDVVPRGAAPDKEAPGDLAAGPPGNEQPRRRPLPRRQGVGSRLDPGAIRGGAVRVRNGDRSRQGKRLGQTERLTDGAGG